MPLVASTERSQVGHVKLDGPNDWQIGYVLQAPTEPTQDDDPLLIFAHPFTNNSEYWQPQLQSDLIGGRYWCLAFDAAGHGTSPTYGRQWDIQDTARAIVKIASTVLGESGDTLDRPQSDGFPSRAVCIGCSMGGFGSLRGALLDAQRVRSQHKRPLIAGVLSFGSSAEPEHKDFVEEYYKTANAAADRARSGNPLEAIKMIADGIASDQYGKEAGLRNAQKSYDWGRAVIERSLSYSFAANSLGKPIDASMSFDKVQASLEPQSTADQIMINFNALLKRDGIEASISSKDSTVLCPVLIVHGTEDVAYPIDRKFPETKLKHLQSAGVKAEIKMIEGAPHFGTVSFADEFNRILADWLKTI
ncbi:uncharacterized protein L969DRAFT_83873 [Mixia osmundae IAM 14324]|uniref:AB hydrolase-1 domain-containing protein n=1 Tax=Mixia osmundae (strain CBS 9802 / IAM 14324 / JCM 22182 / KY 12970) TaxID=764103 RepID=G7E413_MIXOS|nr:uncharacterized protein L969DRAFT_83873 [Mixia osmundae IAM 14324]KEI42019.1 hypothetical protein L969DRAFT_83873 [Mixia osmundae IAM 14324]GAA97573.1 hypothetical protein E5Q_04251 [Mixia osmundae IAM 14324]